MVRTKDYFALCLALIFMVLIANAQQPADQHHNHQQDPRLDGVNARGDHAMGFSHEKTTHHFRLTTDGGAIEVVANDSKDTASLEQIRAHLSHIAKMFKEGDFTLPMFTHGEAPPGVSTMTRLKADINYSFESVERGGQVRIVTSNAEAIDAIHEFLRYQIRDHQTGDPLEVDKQAAAHAGHSCAGMKDTCPFALANSGGKKLN
jgi:hypothetical protein